MNILEKINSVLSEGATPVAKAEMVEYLLDSGALFHNEEGTREQFERMRDEELKDYYDYYKELNEG